jgi:hypothetical protein
MVVVMTFEQMLRHARRMTTNHVTLIFPNVPPPQLKQRSSESNIAIIDINDINEPI